MSNILLLSATALALYIFFVLFYTLVVRLDLAVPKITSKLPLTDQPTWHNFVPQLLFAFVSSLILEPLEAVVLISIAITASLLLLLLFEVFGFASKMSISLQVIGLLLVAAYPAQYIFAMSAAMLAMARLVNTAARHANRYDKRVARLVKSYRKRLNKDIPQEASFIFDVALSIMVVEALSRPKVFRLGEKIAKKTFYQNVPMSTGIMQVTSKKLLTDSESIKKALRIIRRLDKQCKTRGISRHQEKAFRIASQYNGDEKYAEYLMPIYNYISSGVFKEYTPRPASE